MVICKYVKLKNIVAQGENALFEQFQILSQCFKKLPAEYVSKCICMGEKG